MSQYVAARLTRGQSGVGQFAIANAVDIQLPDAIAIDLTARNAIEEWRRTPYMECYVIAADIRYRLGADVTIAGQVWTEIVYTDPNALVYDDILDADGFIQPQLIKNLFINDAYVIDSEAAMLALVTVTGNALVRTDTGQVFIKLNNDDPSDITDFADITGNTGAVTSVNGLTGAVSITIANLLAVGANLTAFNAAVAANSLVLSHSASIASLTTNKADLVAGTVPLAQLPYVFQSGLTRSTAEVNLGGNLLYDTEIGVDTFNFVIDAAAGKFGINVGSDAAYDLLARGTDGYLYRVPKGAENQVLKISGGMLQWSNDLGGTTGAGVAWGAITGTITDQSDLITYLGTTYYNKTQADARYLQLSGGTLTGHLTLNADPTSSLHAATKQYVDSLVVGLWDDRGNYNASVNAYPSSGGSGTAGAILKGDIWTISVAGTLPTAQAVEPGDTVRAIVDTPGNTQANWAIQQNNIGYTPISNVLNSAQILVGSSGNIATAVSMSGDIAITNTGVTSYSGTVPIAKGGTNLTALGTALYLLRVNAGATALEYVDPATVSPAARLLTGTNTFTGPVVDVGTSTNFYTYRNNTSIGATTPISFLLENPNVAAAGAQQYSPALVLRGHGWKTNATAASQTVDFYQWVLPTQGAANPTGELYWASSINGGALGGHLSLSTAGLLVGISGGTNVRYVHTNISGGLGAVAGFIVHTAAVAGNVTSTTGFTFASSLLSVPGRITNTYVSPGASIFRATGSGTVSAEIASFHAGSTLTMTATSGHRYFSFLTGDAITTGAINQIIYGTYNSTAATINHSGVTVVGSYFAPSIAGSVQPVSVTASYHNKGYVQWDSVLSPTQITSSQNDYNPTGWTNGGNPYGSTFTRLSTDAAWNITSWQGGVSGRLGIFANAGSFRITETDDDGSTGTAANRNALAANHIFEGDDLWIKIYDATSSRWRIVGVNYYFTSTLRGLVPASGGGTTNFLRADGTWAAPSGSSSLSSLTAAGATNTINNADYEQIWEWNTLTTNSGLWLKTSSVGFNSVSSDGLLRVTLTGANSGSSTVTAGVVIHSSRTGTGAYNVGLVIDVQGGATNSAIGINHGFISFSDVATSYLADGGANELLRWGSTPSAVNEFTITNAAAGFGPTISSTGDDTDIDFNIVTKGDGTFNVVAGGQSLFDFADWLVTTTEDIDFQAVGAFSVTTDNDHIRIEAGAGGAKNINLIASSYVTIDAPLVINQNADGIILKDTQGTPHYWRVQVSNVGVLTTTDLGTSLP